MRTIKSSYLPEKLTISGKLYTPVDVNTYFDVKYSESKLKLHVEQLQAADKSKLYAIVKVLSKNLKHRTDLHGKPYQPSMWLFVHNKNNQ